MIALQIHSYPSGRSDAPHCLHGVAGGCPSCNAFSSAVAAAVADLSSWTPGVLAALNRASSAPTDSFQP